MLLVTQRGETTLAKSFNPQKFREVGRSYLMRHSIIVLPVLVSVIVVVPILVSQMTGNTTGFLEIGNINAIGLVAFSYVNAIGLVPFSYVNSVGLVAFSPVNSVGIVSIGAVNTVGVIAIGGLNVFGVIAIGYNAVGIVAIGSRASGIFCLPLSGNSAWWGWNPSAVGRHVFSPDRQDAKAVELFTRWMPRLKSAFSSNS